MELVIGTNAIEVTDAAEGVLVTVTAAYDNSYTLKLASGETNAVVTLEQANGTAETISFPYAFDLAAGESITFRITTADQNADTVDLMLDGFGDLVPIG